MADSGGSFVSTLDTTSLSVEVEQLLAEIASLKGVVQSLLQPVLPRLHHRTPNLSRSRTDGLCWYYASFAEKANRCQKPCSLSVEMAWPVIDGSQCHRPVLHRKLRKENNNYVTESNSRQVTLYDSIEKSTPLSRSSPRHKQLVEAVGAFIVEDLRPVAIVDGKGFTKLMKVAEPRFTIPSRTYFSQTVLPAHYVDAKKKVEALLSTTQYCSITTDVWTAKYQTRGYLSLTCHFIDNEWTLRPRLHVDKSTITQQKRNKNAFSKNVSITVYTRMLHCRRDH